MAGTDVDLVQRLMRAMSPASSGTLDGPWFITIGGLISGGGNSGFTISSTGGLQTTPDALNYNDDNTGVTPSSYYPVTQTYTATGVEGTTVTMTVDLTVGGNSMMAMQSFEGCVEISNAFAHDLTAMSVKLEDTVGVTTHQGQIYNVYNTPAANTNVVGGTTNILPTFSALHNSTAFFKHPMLVKGGFKTMVITFTVDVQPVAGGTIVLRFKGNPYPLPISSEYFVFATGAIAAAVTNATILSAATNVRFHLLKGRITNDGTATATAAVVNNDTNKTALEAKNFLAAPGGWNIGPYLPHGIAASAVNQAVNLTTTNPSGTPNGFIDLLFWAGA